MSNQTSIVYGKFKRAVSLAAHLGPQYTNVTVSPGGGTVYISALNNTTSPQDYNDIKLNVGLFIVSVLSLQPPPVTNLVGGQLSVEALGKIISTKDE